MAFAKYDPRNQDRTTEGLWSVESREQALARAPGFAIRFFEELFRIYPQLTNEITFLRSSEQPEDIFAVFAKPNDGFGVQVDSILGYLIVWGDGGQAEYGHWHEDVVPPALEHVRQLVFAKISSES